MGNVLSVALALGTAIANWFVFRWAAQHFGSSRPEFVANIALLSLGLHELAHWGAFRYAGIKSRLAFLVFFGGTFPNWKGADLNRIRWSRIAFAYLAGVMANTAIIVAAPALEATSLVTDEDARRVIQLSGTFIVISLIPFFKFDGGIFARLLFDSIPEERDGLYARQLILWTGIAGLVIALVSSHRQFLALILLVPWGILFQAKHDDPKGSTDRLALTSDQQKLWAVIYLALLVVGMVAMTAARTWLV